MNPTRQMECVELMVSANNLTVPYAEANQRVRQNAAHCGIGLEIFEFIHAESLVAR